MKFSLSWLADYLHVEPDIDQVCDTMIRAGLEVEHVEDPAKALSVFSIAKIISADTHPNADRLRLCQVDTKDGMQQIVCGAPNARAGIYVVYAPVGAYVPGIDTTLSKAKIRGVESHGMLCSARELMLGEEHDGILELEGDFSIGQPVSQALNLNDKVIDFEVTPNRPDWLGVTGIARDLSAAGLGAFKLPPVSEIKGEFACPFEIRIEASEACSGFAGRLIKDVKNGPSPDWLQARLKAIGINPKNMLVDVTNYISFDRARPLHVYDADKLSGTIRARLGQAGETLLALDEKTYDIDPAYCVIADDSGTIGLGGIMGGVSTAVDESTVNVFIESALFDPLRTAKTGRSTGIISDARYRFERGVDPESLSSGLDLASALILEHCGGRPSEMRYAGKYYGSKTRQIVEYNPSDLARLTGMQVDEGEMQSILEGLGFEVEIDKTPWRLKVPGWRYDIEQSADLVEEIARIKGFEALPTLSLPSLSVGERKPVRTHLQNRVAIARRVMAARGFHEAISWSFMPREEAIRFGGGDEKLVISNPVASELNCMRPTILGNLARAAGRNADHGEQDIRLFEAGPIYLSDGPEDQRMVISAMVKPHAKRHWQGGAAPYDIYSAKGDLFTLLEAIGQAPQRFQLGKAPGEYWHPGRSAALQLGSKNIVASFGQLHPRLLKSMDLDGVMIGFELCLDNLPSPKHKGGKTKPRFEKPDQTPIRRDFAFLVDANIPAGDLVKQALSVDKALIMDAQIFDIYRGKGIEAGQKSIALEILIQPKGKSLNDKQLAELCDKVIAVIVKKSGASLRE